MCVFCETNGDLIVSESKNSLILINCFPMGKMSLLAIPKRHVESLSELTAEELNDFFQSIVLIENKVKAVLRPEGINIFINEGEIAGQTVNHLHCHIVFRGKNDGLKNFMRKREKKIITPAKIKKIKNIFKL
ncbi:HIT family protein [Candidatus Falkowbacteria bacterium HGW-Falkowbacteria-1]|jgi:diadenosine tetraphosphate (Ap4A) HIT family hydrolase|uniref:HIT family protein n=1 Tax=Candidatus Falkowbacteria bacterium HGW-Falkowbacteria-1 TaxID=2013768 RepID=A0A2N2EAU3_9BACT|nr:MAG: HIT family protein [Candidatus Falkowbacteria bacterium HGW-Falkowbacteria-1]